MKCYECIFLDRDGTLNPDPGYINKIEDFNFYDFIIPALKKLTKAGNKFCIVTNQSGVSRGIIKSKELDKINNFIRQEFIKNSINLLGIYMCTDHPDQATERRKPGPGMFLEAELDHGLSLVNCLMVGDSFVDIKAGEMLGMDTMLVKTGNGLDTLNNIFDYQRPTYVVQSLKEGAEQLCL